MIVGIYSKEFLPRRKRGCCGFQCTPARSPCPTAPPPIRRSERYDDSLITERKPFKWPGDNSLAVWFAPNVEVWQYTPPSASVSAPIPRITCRMSSITLAGVRPARRPMALADVLDEAGVKATVALNSQVCDVYPKAVEEMKKRGWEFMGHGTTI